VARLRNDFDEAGRREVQARTSLLSSLIDQARSVVEHFSKLSRIATGRVSGERLPEERPPSPLSPATARSAEADLGGFFGDIRRLVESLARELGRPSRFVSRVEPGAIGARVGLLRDVLPQLMKNALVHGVEEPGTRAELGKPAVATLQFAARPVRIAGKAPADAAEPTWVEWIVQDDGRGIAPETLPRIFDAGFSTAAEVSLHAGRGIGLDLVRAKVEEAGGHVEAHSRAGQFCAVRIVLPAEEWTS
jgi:two-component system, chemotaxis family, sensor kinase CheA